MMLAQKMASGSALDGDQEFQSKSTGWKPQPSTEPETIVEGRRAPLLASQRSVLDEDLLAYGAATFGELEEEVAVEDGDRSDSVTVLVHGHFKYRPPALYGRL